MYPPFNEVSSLAGRGRGFDWPLDKPSVYYSPTRFVNPMKSVKKCCRRDVGTMDEQDFNCEIWR